jgi:hypothetical protein
MSWSARAFEEEGTGAVLGGGGISSTWDGGGGLALIVAGVVWGSERGSISGRLVGKIGKGRMVKLLLRFARSTGALFEGGGFGGIF